ncbi:hypothetical protein JY464_07085 [Stenotrophomonas maltophilia]|nr:hypothetical protein [Stenotrophomonas maltophilia]
MADAIKHAKAAAKAEAHLYVWETVVAILEGSASPDRDRAAIAPINRVIAIAKKEQQRLLAKYDAELAKVDSQAVGNG